MPASVTIILGDLLRVHAEGRMSLIPIAEIVAVRSCENYSTIHLQSGETITVRVTLKLWKDVLPATTFAQVHRTAIVNRRRFRGYTCLRSKQRYLIVQDLAEPVAIGRLFWPQLKQILQDVTPVESALRQAV
ncbi:LytTR family DNA-binding domain-containing protein [Oleiharenicola lentus]|uniref:LytTR family DNA-binding domain-containing protein n=1 Tax=Oleiharenicola lentus TaxID=2508720 RepID=UPI003F672173